MKPPIYITRKQAQKLIEELRAAMNQGDLPHVTANQAIAHSFRGWAKLNGIPDLEHCPGEAHSNAFIDNCGHCAPRWGLIGPEVKVR